MQVNPHLVLDSSRQFLPVPEQALIPFHHNRSGHGKSAAIGNHWAAPRFLVHLKWETARES